MSFDQDTKSTGCEGDVPVLLRVPSVLWLGAFASICIAAGLFFVPERVSGLGAFAMLAVAGYLWIIFGFLQGVVALRKRGR
ncbi:hypothetical protein BKK79_37275 (plasmid) [Cupriavidus sp. USMAA2-4]|uniref:hypothetical protein n=1 Tax=Cupriavidus sp. USMAA2-4 TaxID=876364 RepID=UPI0008A6E128|nr:hypothetical protein [Cupriavidus sp. USMAA2-4]AOY97589.1 hypothetical protein BKK79_37275 [Cupriavidus sp. USMAA2-4]